MKRSLWTMLAIAVVASPLLLVGAEPDNAPTQAQRDQAVKLQGQGNWKEAYDIFRTLATDPKDDPGKVGIDLTHAIECLNRLGRIKEFDSLVEAVIAAHKDNWRLLQTAAHSYMNTVHYGTIVAGEFERGPHRGGTAKYANSYERDRVRALQLMDQARPLADKDPAKAEAAHFYMDFAGQLLANRGWAEAWRLQYLTDLTELPDYEEGYYYGYGRYGGSSGRGAPVNEDGSPVYHYTPKSWEDSTTDGQRWRWALKRVTDLNAARTIEVKMHFADFLHNQFGVQTLQQYNWYFARRSGDDDKKSDTGTFDLHTLGEDETIARLATGPKRFKPPAEFNFVKIYQDVADGQNMAQAALDRLAPIFENRRQYPRAAGYWKQCIERFGAGPDAWRQKRLDQIVDPWGMFEPIMTAPAGQGATVEYRFRNGKKVSFTAHEIKVDKLLADVKAYLKTHPAKLDWQQMNIDNLGWRLVEKNQAQYLGKEVASWELDLKPRENHFDKRVTVTTPLQKAGAYLVTAKMEGGNICKIVMWVADTAIVNKALDGQTYYYVADAVTGKPIAKANVEFFGYWQEYVQNKVGNRSVGSYVLHTRDFAEFTDADGQIFVKPDEANRNYSWLIIARTDEKDGGRFAYLGFTGIWHSNYYDSEYNATKTFFISDRPVYRPAQTVKFKFWVNHAQYDQEGKSAFAGRSFKVRINDPKGEKVFEKACTADEFGGFDGEMNLPEEATLGMYYAYIEGGPGGGGHFRVEEYKKPEFEVSVEAPDEPIMLGEKIAAKINAKYYFGAPVTEAKVKYKVLRTSHDARWYPICPWDWFYERGYWWFAYDYVWYPGWNEWGCKRPVPWWWWHWGWARREQPEVVAEGEAEIGADGTYKVEIDTAIAKEIYGDQDHKYEITAEVTDKSRRTIVGTGSVLVARKPFKVYAWVDRGHYRVGDVVLAQFNAQTLDSKPVKGDGALRLLKVGYEKDKDTGRLKPVETEIQKWDLPTGEEGRARQQLKADAAGQYRLSYTVTDAKGHKIEGGYVFCVRGAGFDGGDFRFNDLELVADKAEYAPGDKVNLMVNTDRAGGTVLLFVRAVNGVCKPPKVIRLKGKSVTEQIEVVKRDMPNFFVEALTVAGGKVYTEMREVIVPPESRVLKVAVEPSAKEYKPGEKASVKIKVTDDTGEPFTGSLVVSLYDKAVEYISGGSNVPEIKEFFWKWRRHHNPSTQHSLTRGGGNLTLPKQIAMGFLGVFGYSVATEMDALEESEKLSEAKGGGRGGFGGARRESARQLQAGAAPMAPGAAMADATGKPEGVMANALGLRKAAGEARADKNGQAGEPGQPMVQPTIRTKFADTAYWAAALLAKDGTATVELTMPENLTTWKTRVWAMGAGTRCGEESVEVVTTKNLIVRLQAPRFFVQKDEVVLSANVHNYLKTKKSVKVELGPLTDILQASEETAKQCQVRKVSGTADVAGYYYEKTIEIEAGGEARVDWRVKVVEPGMAKITMKALTDEESDAMRMEFPVYVHGMLKTESFSGVIRPDEKTDKITINVPAERRPEQSRLEVRYSPTLAGAMVDALPYMVEYPYGCTEQTLNRFLPTVITQKVLLNMGLDLKDIRDKQTNLNAQEIGNDVERQKDWKRLSGKQRWDGEKWVDRNPVFDEETVRDMVKAGLERLTSMQCSDGGWGWFSGWGERSYPHTTAVVVHGLQIARANDVAIVPGVIERGVNWLKKHQAEQVRRLKLPKTHREHKSSADALDAFIYMVLVDEKTDNDAMRDFLYRDRNNLPVYTKAMFGLACHKVGDKEKRDMLIRNIEQFLVTDDENQTSYLKLPENNWWWCWYGSEYEAHAYYLKLLAATDPKGQTASRLVKYLINNRRHATYWKSTRDTAVVIEAFADYIKASGEDKPDMTVQVLLDGKKVKEVKIDKANLFSFDNKLVLTGKEVTTGKHTVELTKDGTGPVYFNAYLTNFTLEDPITKAGLEIKVTRSVFKLVEVDKRVAAEGARGQAVTKKVEKFKREPLANLDTLKSGDLIEVELVIESKNDYEYILFEDMKAAGFEPVEVRSGYTDNDMRAYVEFRDERVVFFVRALARGKHSVSYRLRAEIPGKFSALPTKASAMYAPELKANSDEIKLRIVD